MGTLSPVPFPRLLAALASAGLLLLGAASGAQGEAPRDGTSPEELQAALAEAAALLRPAQRRAAARALARGTDVTIGEWQAAMRAFRPREDRPAASVVSVDLFVDGQVERTELVLYVPDTYDPSRPAPLMMAHHGTGGDGRGAAGMWRRLADDLGMLVLAPSEAGPNEGYACSPRERESTLEALRWMRLRFNVDDDRIFISGFSRGGHLAWDVALRHPDRFAALVPMVGGPRFELRRGVANLRYLENAKHMSIRDLQGARDDPGLVFNVRLAFERLAALGARDAVLHEFPDLGHSVDLGAVDWHAFLGRARRDPVPREVVRMYAREGEGRAFWVEVLQGGKRVEEVFRPKLTAAKHAAMSADDLRRFLVDEARQRTGRLVVRQLEPGRFEAEERGIARFRLLLTEEMLGPRGSVEVRIRGKLKKRRARPDARLLLEEFVERLDRRFLPVAEVVIRS